MCSRSAETSKGASDPLEDIYCKTLKRRLLSDLLIAVAMFVLTTSLFLSTVFCRHTVNSVCVCKF